MTVARFFESLLIRGHNILFASWYIGDNYIQYIW